jgi:hypothetical protein
VSDERPEGIEEPEMPDIQLPAEAILEGGGFDGDFASVMRQVNESDLGQDVPIHPQGGKLVQISEEEAKQSATPDRQLFKYKGKLRAEYGQFDLGDADQRSELQNMINNCLQKGWLLAREDWHRDKEGNTIVAIKCLIPVSRRNKNKGNDDKSQ